MMNPFSEVFVKFHSFCSGVSMAGGGGEGGGHGKFWLPSLVTKKKSFLTII